MTIINGGLYSLLWYEWYGFNIQSPLIHRHVSWLTLIGILYGSVINTMDLLRVFLGPLGSVLCLCRSLIGIFFISVAICNVNIMAIVRYGYVFHYQTTSRLNEDLVLRLSLVLNLSLNSYFLAVYYLVPGNLNSTYRLCMGHSLTQNQLVEKVKKVVQLFFPTSKLGLNFVPGVSICHLVVGVNSNPNLYKSADHVLQMGIRERRQRIITCFGARSDGDFCRHYHHLCELHSKNYR